MRAWTLGEGSFLSHCKHKQQETIGHKKSDKPCIIFGRIPESFESDGSCRDQEGRRGSDEVVQGTSVVPSSETGMRTLLFAPLRPPHLLFPWTLVLLVVRGLCKVCLGRKPPRAPQLEETPETPPSSRAEEPGGLQATGSHGVDQTAVTEQPTPRWW